MVIETQPPALTQWLPEVLPYWLFAMGILALVVLVTAYLRLAITHGVGRGGEILVLGVIDACSDVLHTSPRRVLALAGLSIREAIRRRAFVGFLVFVVVMLLALWFLDANTTDPAALYISFVLGVTNFVVVLMALLLSVFSLPADMKNKTIYTVVTKPVRPTEIVLGRVVGFAAIGTAVLVLTGFISYFFVVRTLDHTHEIEPGQLETVEAGEGTNLASTVEGRTGETRHHHHRVTLGADGQLKTDTVQGHWHPIETVERDGRMQYLVSSPQGQFHARVPIYGTLKFTDRNGQEKAQGINVGDAWSYRSYVGGGGLESAVWKFDAVTPERFPAGLPLDLTIQVFRTHKGNIESGILGSLVLRNPRTRLSTAPRNFMAREFVIDRHLFPRKLTDADGNSIDLFDDLVSDGQVEVVLTCLDSGQFFGMAQADMYLLAREGSFGVNLFKGFTSIWLQMVLVTSVGVMWSTFLNGAVAMLATLGTVLLGISSGLIGSLASGEHEGGGSVESLVRILQHKNIRVELENTWGTMLVELIDAGVRHVMQLLSWIAPNFSALGDGGRVAGGFDVPWDLLAIQALTVLGFVVPTVLLGFIFFKSREVAQ